MEASLQGYFEIVKLLLDKGAEVNYQKKVSYNCSNHVQSISLACTRWLVIYRYVLDVGIRTYLFMVFIQASSQTNHHYDPYMYMYFLSVSL